jgi:hypothetical protein
VPEAVRTAAEVARIKGGGQLGAGPPPGTDYRGHQWTRAVLSLRPAALCFVHEISMSGS